MGPDAVNPADKVGKDVKITLDPWGKVRKLELVAAAGAKALAVVAKVEDRNYLIDGAVVPLATLTLLKADGTTATTRVATKLTVGAETYSNPNTNYLASKGVVQKALIEYTLDAGGNVDSIDVRVAAADAYVSSVAKDPNRITCNNVTSLIGSDTVVFYVYSTDPTQYKTITTDTLLAATGSFDAAVLQAADGVTAKAVVVKGTISSVAAEESYGLVVGDYVAADGYRHIKINVKGTVTDYKFNVPYTTVSFMADDVAKFKPSADGSIDAANFTKLDPATAAVSGEVTAVGSNYVQVKDAANATHTYWLTSKTQVFNLNKSGVGFAGSTSDLVVGLTVRVYAHASNNALVITFNEQ